MKELCENHDLFEKFMRHPWKNWDEWNTVCDLISNKGDENMKIAYEKMISWLTKGILPISLETYGLMSKEIYETKNINAISLLIIRFCNGIVGPLKVRNIHVPFETLYKIVGIPEYLIRIRHCLTHGAIPSKDELSKTAEDILNYIEQNYFVQQTECIKSRSDEYREFIVNFANNSTDDTSLFDAKTLDIDYVIGVDVFLKLVDEGTINSDNVNVAIRLLTRCAELDVNFKRMISVRLATDEKHKGKSIYTDMINLMSDSIDTDIVNEHRAADDNKTQWKYISIGMNPFGKPDARLAESEYIII